MRRLTLTCIASAFLSCGPNAKFNQTCSRITATICNHLVECSIEVDIFACEQKLDRQFYCDESRELSELEECLEQAEDEALECFVAIPEDCLRVLCPVGEQCGEDEDTGTPCAKQNVECEKTGTTGDTAVETGGTGGTGDTGAPG